jgi:UDP-glucose 4-epimerase
MIGMSRLVVTGAGGFLGSRISADFAARGWDVLAVGTGSAPADGCRPLPLRLPAKEFAAAVREFQPRLLVHAAGPASVAASIDHPHEDFRHAVEPTAHVLETLRVAAPDCVFAFLSSGAVYGDAGPAGNTEGDRCQPVSPYGYHKLQCELLAEEYQAIHGLRILVLRIFSVFGEGLRRQVIHDLFQKFVDPAAATVDILGKGDEIRDFVHIDDVVAAIDFLFAGGHIGTYNLGGGAPCSIHELAALIGRTSGHVKPIRFTGEHRRGDPLRMKADMSRLTGLGFRPRVALAEGIVRYRDWLVREDPYA